MHEHPQDNTRRTSSGVTSARQQLVEFVAVATAAAAGVSVVIYLMVTPSSVQPIMLELAGEMLRLMLAVTLLFLMLLAVRQ